MVNVFGAEDAAPLHEYSNCARVRLESLTYFDGPLRRTIQLIFNSLKRLVPSAVIGSLLAFAALSRQALTATAVEPAAIQFNRDIRPILAENCFHCHGPDASQRKSGLRLDAREAALKPADSGELAIVSNRPEDSALIKRIESDDPERANAANRFEKAAFGSAEGPAQALDRRRGTVRTALVVRAATATTGAGRADFRMGAERHRPVRAGQAGKRRTSPARPEADNVTLFRRVSLSSIWTRLLSRPQGRPAPLPWAKWRAATGRVETDATCMPAWVDKFLASPHYGERMAVDWLDAARFADSNGYQVDRDRENYAWRDWVIKAFNDNKPFDQFTIEQIAGDLLEGATLDQKIATGFHRNHMLNEEGGIIGEEFLAEYCADRVETTAIVWLAQTFGCARCHDHKYDPFTQRDFYGMFAFFHNVNEAGVGNYGANIRRNAPPMIKLPAPEIETQIATLNIELAAEKQRAAEIQDQDCRQAYQRGNSPYGRTW